MANGINKVILIGNLGNDPDIRYGQGGNAVCNISVATSESWKDRDGNRQERTEWHRVVSFGKLAEIMGEYLRKGSKVYVEGKLRTEQYEKDGVQMYSTKVYADEMRMLSGREGGEDRPQQNHQQRPQQRPQQSSQQRQAPRQAPKQEEFPDDDIPF